MPYISVIIPVYNAKEYLERCLDSIINQTLENIEIICIDDCSTDSSLDILYNYQKRDNRVRVITCNKNGGESVARNIGIKNAIGQYLGFVDNDDLIDLNFYEKLYTKAQETNADIIKGEVEEITYSKHQRLGDLNKTIKANNYDKLFFTYHWWTAIYKRKLIIKKNILFPEKFPLGGDILFLNKSIIAANSLELVDNAYYHYYRRENSGDSKILTNEKLLSALKIYEMCIENLNNAKNIEHQSLGFKTVSYWFIRSNINLAYRNHSRGYKEIAAKYLLRLYSKSENKSFIDENIVKDFSEDILYCIKNAELENLIKHLTSYASVSKTILANLRQKRKGS